MKKRYIVALLLLVTSKTHAQRPVLNDSLLVAAHPSLENAKPQNDISWGIKAGANSYNLYGKEIDFIFADAKTSYKPGFHLGIFVDSRLSSRFALKHELIFNQRRVAVSLAENDIENYKSSMMRNYIDLMPASITFQEGNFQLFAGPYISALLKANLRRKDEQGKWFKDPEIYGNGANDESESRYLQKFDFGLNMGIEYTLTHKLLLGTRYLHGFTDLFQYANSHSNESSKTNAIKVYNRGWMLSLGYRF